MITDPEICTKINAIKLHTDPMTQAQLVVELLAQHSIKQIDLARELQMKASYLSHLIRVMKLPEMVIDGYWNKHLTFTHLILISRLKKPDEIIQLYEEILTKNLNVSATEKRIREILYLIDNAGKYINKERLDSIRARMMASLGPTVDVAIIQTRIKAKIVVEVSGNLALTSEFIELFGARFRSKRQKQAEDDFQKVQQPPIHEDIPTNTNPIDQTPDEPTLDDDADQKKFRFDPDF